MDWFIDHAGWFVLGFMALLATLTTLALIGESRAQSRFMADCLNDRPQYECTAMWRGGNVSVVPMPVIIPVR